MLFTYQRDETVHGVVGLLVQPVTRLTGANASTSQSLIEEFRYRTVPDGDHSEGLVAELSLYKDPAALSRLEFPLSNFTRREAVSQFVFATAADDRFIFVSVDAIAHIQAHFPNHSIYFYDLSDGVLVNKVQKVTPILPSLVHSPT